MVVALLGPGLAKLGHHPGEAFMRVFIETCMATELKGLNSIDFANIINGSSIWQKMRTMVNRQIEKRTVMIAGFAKLEHHPGEAFMRLFVDACTASELKGFKPQPLANILNGKEGPSDYKRLVDCRSDPLATLQDWQSSSMTPGRPS
jgi:hypothetical protein